MHIEIQVALNFVISYLYNKLPRRRVNLFGEELERALREKFNGHWYPEKPVRGSAYRCIKTGNGPVDPVLERAARESGIPVQDILENMPQELAVWVDPAEVSYRIGEKGQVRILYSEANGNSAGINNSTTPTHISSEDDLDTEVRKTFNPDAQCFRPIQNALGNLNLGPSTVKQPTGCVSPYQSAVLSPASPPPSGPLVSSQQQPAPSSQKVLPPSVAVVPVQQQCAVSAAGTVSPVPQAAAASTTAAPFLGRPNAPPLTFTTATFAQTKFGSTKLKTSSKRANRMSPTEFSNYIKQRALQQQQQQQQTQQNGAPNGFVGSRPRSLSPHPPAQPSQPQQPGNPENYFFPGRHYLHFPAPQYHHQPHPLQSEMHFAPQHHKFPTYMDSQPHYFPTSVNLGGSGGNAPSAILPPAMSPTSSANVTSAGSPGAANSPGVANASSGQNGGESGGKQQLLDGLNFGLQTYQSGQYQHLLVAN